MVAVHAVADIETMLEDALWRERRVDDRLASLAAHLMGAAGAKMPGGRAVTPSDLLGRDPLPMDPRTAEEGSELLDEEAADERAEKAEATRAWLADAQAEAAARRGRVNEAP